MGNQVAGCELCAGRVAVHAEATRRLREVFSCHLLNQLVYELGRRDDTARHLLVAGESPASEHGNHY